MWASITAATAIVTVIWNRWWSMWNSMSAYGIDEVCGMEGEDGAAMQLWLHRHTTAGIFIPLPIRFYQMRLQGNPKPVMALGSPLWMLLDRASLRWYGWIPVWVDSWGNNGNKIRFIRGTINKQAIVREIHTGYVESIEKKGDKQKRHFVQLIAHKPLDVFSRAESGGGQQPAGYPSGKLGEPGTLNSSMAPDWGGRDPKNVFETVRWLSCNAADIDLGSTSTGDMEEVALPAGGDELVRDLEAWLELEDWFLQRQIPWRLGWLLHGKPGTGKTKTIRTLAVKYDLPLILIDLNGMTNHELHNCWEKMLNHAPAIVVFEDFDTVFHGREPVQGPSEDEQGRRRPALTFDAILQCLDGIKPSHGLVTVITTNKPEHIDEALGVYDGKTNTVKCRPGRVDRAVFFGNLAEEGKWKIVNRILADLSETEREAIVQAAAEVTGAEMQQRCIEIARDRLAELGVTGVRKQQNGH